jgi:hypothetical protein
LIRAVGIILVIALLTIPAATAGRFTSNLAKYVGIAIMLGMFFTSGGLFLSYYFDLPSVLPSFTGRCCLRHRIHVAWQAGEEGCEDRKYGESELNCQGKIFLHMVLIKDPAFLSGIFCYL